MRKQWIPGFALLIIVALLSLLDMPSGEEFLADPNISGADTAWMLAATALVLLMTPGLSFFYGGMVSRKNVISTMLQSFICMGVITLVWVVGGFSLAFGDSIGGFIGDPRTFFLFQRSWWCHTSRPSTNYPVCALRFISNEVRDYHSCFNHR